MLEQECKIRGERSSKTQPQLNPWHLPVGLHAAYLPAFELAQQNKVQIRQTCFPQN